MRTHKQWIQDLEQVAQHSHDPDTQTACIVVDSGGFFVASGANKIPDRLKVTAERLQKPAKYDWIQHAERRVLNIAAASFNSSWNGTMYLNWFPCAPCAEAIIQSGISTLYADWDAYEARKDDPRYGFALSMEKLLEAGVLIRWFSRSSGNVEIKPARNQ